MQDNIKSFLSTLPEGIEFSHSEEDLLKYSRDYTPEQHFPELVLKPKTKEEVSQILKSANELKIPVTPRGAGTGLSGGALCVNGGISLSLERMNKIIEIDDDNFLAIVEPGVITQVLQEECEKRELFYPPDPASRGSCLIGGNAAEDSGGPRALKYGTTKQYILALEAVLPSGEIINTGAQVLKNVTGYNLTQLLVGSEGTLAVITKITLKLLPLPKYKALMLASFNSLEDCAKAVAEIFKKGVIPSVCELMEKDAVKAAEEQLGKIFPNGDAGGHLLIEIDGNDELQIDEEAELLSDALGDAIDVIYTNERSKMDELWSLRRCMGEAVKSISDYKEEDTVVPRARIPKLINGVKEICRKYNIRSICYGHAGDGNIHVNLLQQKMDKQEWDELSEKAIVEIFKLAVQLGGTITGEHGVGLTQKNYLPIALSETELNLMNEIKKVFDPNGILNPGKIFV